MEIKISEWEFELGREVKIKISGEKGQVVGRVQYLDIQSQYQVNYLTTDGRAAQNWFFGRELTGE